jgi:predicted RNA-binding Zn-ribbon protein involved in translation (DUF1610 family)
MLQILRKNCPHCGIALAIPKDRFGSDVRWAMLKCPSCLDQFLVRLRTSRTLHVTPEFIRKSRESQESQERDGEVSEVDATAKTVTPAAQVGLPVSPPSGRVGSKADEGLAV